ncbi:MAG TPA: hypothetical protein VFU15_03245 [Bacteroidia bacterium]|nr:hypothetical protein [Bacteroidia bacterium]
MLVFLLAGTSGRAQGCSDGGLCSFGTMGILQPRYVNIPLDQVKLTPMNVVDSAALSYTHVRDTSMPAGAGGNAYVVQAKSVDTGYVSHITSCELSAYYGIGEHNTSVIITQLEGNFNLVNRKLYGQVKIPYSVVSGNLGTTNGLSDITMSLSYVAFDKGRSSMSFAAGVKIPSNSSDLSKDNRPLPMVYQTSLGSTDILLGTRFAYRKWDFSAGYQHSFNGNSNHYVHIPGAGDSLTYNGYFESNNLRRADDAMFRINRKFQAKKIELNTGLLFIFHLANDDYTDATGNRVKATGSQGLTLNFDLAGSIPVGKKTDLTFILAKPLKQRSYVTDGLARSFVGIVGIKQNF